MKKSKPPPVIISCREMIFRVEKWAEYELTRKISELESLRDRLYSDLASVEADLEEAEHALAQFMESEETEKGEND